MMIDFRADPQPCHNVTVKKVQEYKYLGTILDNKLAFDRNFDTIHKNVNPEFSGLQKFGNNCTDVKILQAFYHCCVESVLTISIVC